MKPGIIIFVMSIVASICLKAQTNEKIFLTKFGSGRVYLLSEVQRNVNAVILIGSTPEIYNEFVPDGTFPTATNAFLWQINGKNILFDTGFGRFLIDNLQSIKVKAEDIDAICISHMHGDHIGGLLRDDQVVFPNAALYLAQPEYDYWMSDEAMNQMPEKARGGFSFARKVIEAYKDRLHLFEPKAIDSPNHEELWPGIKPIAAFGHTPGHTMYLLESGNDKFLIWGDVTHAMVVQMPYPEKITTTYDTNREESIQSRLEVLQYVSKHAIPIAGMHIVYPGMGIVEKSNPGYRFIPAK